MSDDRVTLRDVYEAINRLEDKFDKRLGNVEEDVSALKAFQNRALGVLGLVALFGGAVSTFIWSKITGKS